MTPPPPPPYRPEIDPFRQPAPPSAIRRFLRCVRAALPSPTWRGSTAPPDAPLRFAIPEALHNALHEWAVMGFEDYGDFFFDLVQAAADAGYGQLPEGGVVGMAYDRVALEGVDDESPF